MIDPEIVEQLWPDQAGALIITGRDQLTDLLERYEEIRPAQRRRKTHCPYGHPFVPENTMEQASNGGRKCRHCNRCGARGVRAGQTLAEYYASNPGALKYLGPSGT